MIFTSRINISPFKFTKIKRFPALFIVIVVGALGISNILQLSQKETFDIFDETAHYDYLIKMENGTIPRTGDLLDQKTLVMVDCTVSIPTKTQDCSDRIRDPRIYPAGGFSYESQQPPIAYLVILITNRIFGSSSDSLASYRTGNLTWYGLAVILLMVFSWKSKLTFFQTWILSSIILLNPIAIHAFSTINNDSMGLAIGLLFLFLLRFKSSKFLTSTFFLISVGVLVGLGKAIFLFLPFSLLFLSLSKGIWSLKVSKISKLHHQSISTLLKNVLRENRVFVIPLLSGLIFNISFFLYQYMRATTSVYEVLLALQGFSLTENLRFSTIFGGVLSNLQIMSTYLPSHIAQLSTYLFVGILSTVVFSSQGGGLRDAALVVIFGAVSLGVFWAFFSFFSGHFDFASPTRYMIVFVPLIGFIYSQCPKFLSAISSVCFLLLAFFVI